MSSASSSPAGQRRRTFKGKSSQGCLTCKNRHVKCDETRPICNNCRRLNRVCIQRDGSSADPRAQASGSTAANPPVPPMGPIAPITQAGGSSASVTANTTPAGPSSVIDATGTDGETHMDESTQDYQNGEETTLSHNTTNFMLTQEATMNNNPSGATFTQAEQRETPNTTISGLAIRGIKRPFSAISNASSFNHEPIMADDKSPTTTSQTNEVMNNSEQRTASYSTSSNPVSQVSTMTNDNITEPAADSGPETSVMTRKVATSNTGSNEVTNNDTQRTAGTADSITSPGSASHLSTTTNATDNNSTSPSNNTSRNICRFTRPSLRLVNAPLSSTSRAGMSFSAISSIESTPEAASIGDSSTSMINSSTPNSSEMATPTNNLITTQSQTTQGNIAHNTTNFTRSTMNNSESTGSPTYAQVTAAGTLSSTPTTASATPTSPFFPFPSAPQPQPQPHYHTPLSLASTRTNRPPGPSFTPLRPIHNWVPPRPAIIARTEWTDAQKAESFADEAARKAEKAQEAERKAAEMEVLKKGAERAADLEKERRAKELGNRMREWHGEQGGRGHGCGSGSG